MIIDQGSPDSWIQQNIFSFIECAKNCDRNNWCDNAYWNSSANYCHYLDNRNISIVSATGATFYDKGCGEFI